MNKLLSFTTLTALTLVAGPVLAHSGHHDSGLGAGLAHPFTGIDHLLAMLAVGFVAFSHGRKGLALPMAFLAFMLVGAGLGFVGVTLPAVETGIAASVLVLGLMLTFTRQVPWFAGALLTSAFAVFHGFAHAAEMTEGSSAGLYMLGFILGTAVLHGFGLGLGALTQRVQQRWLTTVAGLGTAGIGAVLLLGAV